MDAQFQGADNIDQVKASDHLLVMVDNTTGSADERLGGGAAGGIADMYGKIGYMGYPGADLKGMVDGFMHELGHNLGLPHPDQNDENDPMSYTGDGANFTGKEMVDIRINVRDYGSWMNNKHTNTSVIKRGDHYVSQSSNEYPLRGNWFPGRVIPRVIKN